MHLAFIKMLIKNKSEDCEQATAQYIKDLFKNFLRWDNTSTNKYKIYILNLFWRFKILNRMFKTAQTV